MNSEITCKQVAYDLTLEYIRQTNMLNNASKSIEEKTEDIEKIYNSFCDSLKNKNIIMR